MVIHWSKFCIYRIVSCSWNSGEIIQLVRIIIFLSSNLRLIFCDENVLYFPIESILKSNHSRLFEAISFIQFLCKMFFRGKEIRVWVDQLSQCQKLISLRILFGSLLQFNVYFVFNFFLTVLTPPPLPPS